MNNLNEPQAVVLNFPYSSAELLFDAMLENCNEIEIDIFGTTIGCEWVEFDDSFNILYNGEVIDSMNNLEPAYEEFKKLFEAESKSL